MRNRGLAKLIGTRTGTGVDHLGAPVLVERPQDAGPDADRAGLGDPVEENLMSSAVTGWPSCHWACRRRKV